MSQAAQWPSMKAGLERFRLVKESLVAVKASVALEKVQGGPIRKPSLLHRGRLADYGDEPHLPWLRLNPAPVAGGNVGRAQSNNAERELT